MNIEKAIEILSLNVKEAGRKMPSDTLTALKLGIAALKRVEENRLPVRPYLGQPLAGETKD